MIIRNSRSRAFSFSLLAVTVLASGCATKGYVNDRIDELRRTDEEHAAALAGLKNSTEQAMERARTASDDAVEARTLALGHAGLEEIDRHTVYFAFDSDALRDSEMNTLRAAAAEIAEHPEALVDVYGFADPSGPDQYNLALAQRRAAEVLRHLVAANPGELSRYAAVGFGERELAGMAPASEDAERSRRVVVSLIRRTPLDASEPPSANAAGPAGR